MINFSKGRSKFYLRNYYFISMFRNNVHNKKQIFSLINNIFSSFNSKFFKNNNFMQNYLQKKYFNNNNGIFV